MACKESELEERLKVVKFGLTEEERVLTIQNFVDFLTPAE